VALYKAAMLAPTSHPMMNYSTTPISASPMGIVVFLTMDERSSPCIRLFSKAMVVSSVVKLNIRMHPAYNIARVVPHSKPNDLTLM